ncbi:MAG: CCA tRNA nucleotidyltransferase [Acidobacteriota bacterium]|nr:CCA tRNA nucleotidyltransferase [Acidobacteriota bacterium]
MPDYVYLLENRLSLDQQSALRNIREVVREAGSIVFLTGSTVRDLTSGHSVRELEVEVHGNALKHKKALEKRGAHVWGEDPDMHALYLCFPGTVRVDLLTTHRAEYPKPGKPVFHAASIQEDLRRRDFTVNAMAVSLNEGSYGLLMDPLNGVADIEARTLRLVSNYGFLEEPANLIRATRLAARLGWEMDDRTRQRYENAVAEGVIDALSSTERNRELEQIGHEDDGLKVLRALEEAGWMKVLFPAWTSAKADEKKLSELHDLAVQLIMQGVHPDMSAAQMHLLTAKLQSKDVGQLKRHMLRHGFVEEWNGLDAAAAAFSKILLAKENQTPSTLYKLFTTHDPEAVLWLGFTTNSAAVKERYDQFLKVWPEVRQRIPYVQMLEMRIVPELAGYNDLVHAIFLEMIDGRLTTPEEIKVFLEPHAPPAPPPQPTYKRSRARRAASKVKERSFDEDEDEDSGEDEDLDDIGSDDDDVEIDLGDDEEDFGGGDDSDEGEEGDEGDDEPPAPKKGKKAASKPAETEKAAKHPAGKAAGERAKAEAAVKPVPPAKAAAKPAPPKPAQAKATSAKPAAASKPAPAKAPAKAAKPAPKPAKPAKPAPKAAKPAAKPAVKKVAAKPAPKPKPAPAKKKPAPKPSKAAKPAAKKVIAKKR